jgi:hypothetical protein
MRAAPTARTGGASPPVLNVRLAPAPARGASVVVAGRRQLWVPAGGLRLFAPGPFGGLCFQCLPAIGQVRPERPVCGSARGGSKAAAFFGTPPEFV